MQPYTLIKKYLGVLVLAAVLLPATVAVADESLETINQRIKVLEQEAAQTTDLNRLLEIATELGELASMIDPGQGQPALMAPGRGRDPDEEINREIDAINAAYVRQKKVVVGYRDPSAPLVPFLSARKLHGTTDVRGSNQRLPTETPYEGGVLRTLSYTIREDFVGYLVTSEYYDPRTGKFTDKRDYRIKTISSLIHPPGFAGKECIEIIGNNWKACKKWEQYGLYDISKGDQYPAIHEWAIGGAPEDDGIMFEVETPDIVFYTTKKSRARSQGCFGAKIFVPNTDFEAGIEDGKISVQQSVGRDFGGTPHCGKGSTIAVNLELCKQPPRCGQLEDLLDNVLWAIDLRDKYLAKSAIANSEPELVQLVNADLGAHYPGLDITDKEYLKKNAGGYDFYTGKTTLPNLCRGCATRPLCRWNTEGLSVHEKTHELDALKNPVLKKLFIDTHYQMVNYNPESLAREQARVRGEMEHHAYDENARYLMDILKQELSSSACSFPASFYQKYIKAEDALK